MNQRQRKKWHKFINQLKKKFPISYPVKIRTRKCSLTTSAHCIHHFDRFGRVDRVTIAIDTRLSWREKVDSLVHEYAHALECAQLGNTEMVESHSPIWGVNYSNCYRALEELEPWIEENQLWEPK